ncbi:MAG: hypothetical protein ACXWHJ_11155, partial [Candidatus Aminicenantales bacterium]
FPEIGDEEFKIPLQDILQNRAFERSAAILQVALKTLLLANLCFPFYRVLSTEFDERAGGFSVNDTKQ